MHNSESVEIWFLFSFIHPLPQLSATAEVTVGASALARRGNDGSQQKPKFEERGAFL